MRGPQPDGSPLVLQIGVTVTARDLERTCVRDGDRRTRNGVRAHDRRNDAIERVEARQCAARDRRSIGARLRFRAARRPNQ
jgi:hypothetical protein